MMHTNKSGFTLIELLVVISIIGLLSSVVIASLQGARIKAVNARIIQETGQLRSGFELARTGNGYSILKAGPSSNGIAYYSDLSSDVKKVVDDMLKQQGSTVVGSGYPGGDVACSGGASLSVDANTGVVVTTNSTACGTQPTEYAIYSVLMPKGSAGYTCIDSKGGRASAAIGGIALNAVNGVCPGTTSGGGPGGPTASVDLTSGPGVISGAGRSYTVSWSTVGVSAVYGACQIGWISTPSGAGGPEDMDEPEPYMNSGSVVITGQNSFYDTPLTGHTTVTISCQPTASGAAVTDFVILGL